MKPLHRTTLALAMTAWLVACGPGSGGTGTGETGAAFVVFGASTASVCTSGFAGALACGPVIGSPANNPASEVPTMVNFSNVAQGGSLSVAIQANSVELEDRCRKLRFTGDWGITAANDARFFGSYSLDGMAPVIAALSVQPAPSGNPGELTVTLRDAAGRVVLGPVSLQQVGVPAGTVLVCP